MAGAQVARSAPRRAGDCSIKQQNKRPEGVLGHSFPTRAAIFNSAGDMAPDPCILELGWRNFFRRVPGRNVRARRVVRRKNL